MPLSSQTWGWSGSASTVLPTTSRLLVTAALVACQTKPTLTLSLVRPSFFSVCFACLWSAGLLEIETDSESGEGRGGGDEARKNSCSLCRKSSTQTEQLLLEILVRKPVCPPTNHARPADPAGKGGVRGGRWQLPPKVFIFAAPPGGLWGGRVGGQCWSNCWKTSGTIPIRSETFGTSSIMLRFAYHQRELQQYGNPHQIPYFITFQAIQP